MSQTNVEQEEEILMAKGELKKVGKVWTSTSRQVKARDVVSVSLSVSFDCHSWYCGVQVVEKYQLTMRLRQKKGLEVVVHACPQRSRSLSLRVR